MASALATCARSAARSSKRGRVVEVRRGSGVTLAAPPGTSLLDPDPAKYQELLHAKVKRVKATLKDRVRVPMDVIPSEPLRHRMKVTFAIRHYEDGPHIVVCDNITRQWIDVEQYPCACEPVQKLMSGLIEVLREFPELKRKAAGRVAILANTLGDALAVVMYKEPICEEEFVPAAQVAAERLGVSAGFVGRSKRKRVVAGGPGILVQKHEVDGKVYPQIHQEHVFSQSNARICAEMLRWTAARTRPPPAGQGDLLELYCGNGNFTLPLARNFRQVLATETAGLAVDFAQRSAKEAEVENVTFARLSSKEAAKALRLGEAPARTGVDLDRFDFQTVFVDPPRAGLDSYGRDVVRRFPRCVYVSCCPERLAADLEELPEHEVTAAAFFDQFPYTEHAEVAVILQKRAS